MANYYPPVAFSFLVSIAGNDQGNDASFSEVSGLDSRMEPDEVREGGENRFVHQLPGRVRHSNVVLKRGLMVATSRLFKWCRSTLENGLAQPVQTQTLVISLLDQEQAPMMAWSLDRAWPIKWDVDAFKAAENSLAFESIEFSYGAMTRKLVKTKPKTGLCAP